MSPLSQRDHALGEPVAHSAIRVDGLLPVLSASLLASALSTHNYHILYILCFTLRVPILLRRAYLYIYCQTHLSPYHRYSIAPFSYLLYTHNPDPVASLRLPSYTPTAMPSATHDTNSWQDKLDEACREYQIAAPVFQIVSDRRGGRTAWSSRVTVHGSVHHARFWYDGKNLNNAREDAAEVAFNWLSGSSPSSPATSRTGW